MTSDDRLTSGLILDVLDVLERHGYHQYDNRHTGQAVVAALDIAADYKRDRAAACADCADQSCLTCQSRLRDAGAYDQMATQMLQTAKVARTANSAQPKPSGPPPPARQPHSAADREVGQ